MSEQASHGSSLALVLVLITGLSMVFGLVLGTHLLRHRLIGRDVHRLQARYAAEAGVYVALDSLQDDPTWRPGSLLILPGGFAADVTIAAFGGFLKVQADVQHRQTRAAVHALVGQVPPAPFEQAVYLWDTDGRLSVAGTTRVTGTITVGGGVQAVSFRGRRFEGGLAGTIRTKPVPTRPDFDNTLFHQALASATRHLAAAETPEQDIKTGPVYRFEGDLRLTEADSLVWAAPATVVATGNLLVEGAPVFPQGTTLIAGHTLSLHEDVQGQGGLFVGIEAVTVSGRVRCAGQFLSQKQVRITGNAHLLYPSVLYVTGEGKETGSGLYVEEKAVVEGTLLHPAGRSVSETGPAQVVVGPEARLRGSLFNAHTTNMQGVLYGALVTHRLAFYSAPTRYINWLKDTSVDVTARPQPYMLPLRFGRNIRLGVISWLHATERK